MNYHFIATDSKKSKSRIVSKIWQSLHLDPTLFISIIVLAIIGFCLLYSTSNQNFFVVLKQLLNFTVAFIVMLIFAKIPVGRYQNIIPWFYGIVVLMLITVLIFGVISKGGQRWLRLGVFRFQPSEAMKIAVPMMLAWYLRDKIFPLNFKDLLRCLLIISIPVLLIAKQPDLGTAILVAITGFFVIILAGVSWRIVSGFMLVLAAATPIIWKCMYAYQKTRLLIFLSPESDPFNRGYNVIQSKIAIGSGGMFGKGWLQGSQSHLSFLPEASTDFAFAVYGEEFGFIGCLALFTIFSIIIGRALYISIHAQDTFSRLLVGSLTLSFFCSLFVNVGMVSSILPVVGVPLPFISYGGSSLIIFMASFGIIMSIHGNRRFISS